MVIALAVARAARRPEDVSKNGTAGVLIRKKLGSG
jgi:hypothetical protein